MTEAEIITAQKQELDLLLKSILESKSSKKIIVAGAGTGKTHTFREILKLNPHGTNIVMTFIRLLRNDMEATLSSYSEVRTFHEFCKKILHEHRGGFILYPKLTSIIEEDSQHQNVKCENFDEKFQLLDESENEIRFFLKRGDYYNAVSFNDSVYRMMREMQRDPDIISNFDQILIDEFQDFNPLEVAFIDELEKKGNILIVGDDDQAVYDSRFSTPYHLRNKFQSGHYEKFELPFCSRCTEVIVASTNSILELAVKNGNLKDRVSKRFECFIEKKGIESKQYPFITTAHISTMRTVLAFIRKKFSEISADEIAESWEEGKEYPTILIVGKIQYLNPAFKNLKEDFPNITFKQSKKNEVSICDGYEFLSQDLKSNLGWRILIDFIMDPEEIQKIVKMTEDNTPIIGLLPAEIIREQTKIISIIQKFNKEHEDNDLLLDELSKIVSEDVFEEIKLRFLPLEEQASIPDKTQPSVLLTTFQGCKGMSAGFVFIIGANNGIIPFDVNNIKDVEISQFVVALTRTRKKAFIISEDYMYGPKDNRGNWVKKHQRSIFIDWIPVSVLENLGNLKMEDIK